MSPAAIRAVHEFERLASSGEDRGDHELASELRKAAEDVRAIEAGRASLEAEAADVEGEAADLERDVDAVGAEIRAFDETQARDQQRMADYVANTKKLADHAKRVRRLAFRILILTVWMLLIVQSWMPSPVLGAVYAWAAAGALHRFLVAIGILVVALLGYLVRKHQRLHYGTLEVAAAIVGAWFTLSDAKPSTATESLAIIGVIYFMIRGFDNIATGMREEKDLLGAAFEELAEEAKKNEAASHATRARLYILQEKHRKTVERRLLLKQRLTELKERQRRLQQRFVDDRLIELATKGEAAAR